MKQFLSIFLFLFFGVLAAQEITVATFNTEFLNKAKVHVKFGLPYSLNKQSQEIKDFWKNNANRTKKFEEASMRVAKMIKRINADVITLTEVGNKDDLSILISALNDIGSPYKYWEVCNCTDRSTGQKVAILSKHPLKDVWYQIPGRALYLEEPDGDVENETGISKGLKATVRINQKEIDVFVLHFISERSGYESDAKRLAQANIVRRAVIKLINNGRNVIVTGDLNSEKRSKSVYRLRGFDDVYPELIQTGLSKYFKTTQVRWTYNFKGEPEQIDHILISPGFTKRGGIKTSIIETQDAKISDHNPVVVKLSLK